MANYNEDIENNDELNDDLSEFSTADNDDDLAEFATGSHADAQAAFEGVVLTEDLDGFAKGFPDWDLLPL